MELRIAERVGRLLNVDERWITALCSRCREKVVKERQFVERHGLHSAITSPLCGTAVESVVVTLAESGAMHRRANSKCVKSTKQVIVTQ